MAIAKEMCGLARELNTYTTSILLENLTADTILTAFLLNRQKSLSVKAFSEDKKGNLWFGTYSGMLYKYSHDSDQFTSHVPPANQQPLVFQRPINDLYADEEGKIWMATEGGGLIRFDPTTESFKAWRESDGLVMDVCNRILPDGQGKIWVGSYEGFTIFDPHLEKIEHSKVDYGQRENNFYSRGKYLLQNGKLVVGNEKDICCC